MAGELIAPFPWFGGKRRVAAEVWERFGDVPNYVEPFAGSLAVLLQRPAWHTGAIETINDIDKYVSNFWRALSIDPDGVAQYADWPVNEADLFARHLWLVNDGRRQLRENLDYDPNWYDARIAGWWVWGLCAWIGSGWCSGDGPHTYPEDGDAGQGVNRQLPHMSNAGQGVNRQLPHMGDAGQGVLPRNGALLTYMRDLSRRLQRVRVACGDWSRVVTASVTERHGLTGVFLDPPYGDGNVDYSAGGNHSGEIAEDVRQWAIANGDNPLLRIALCGYEPLEMPDVWRKHRWKARKGYQVETTNPAREVVWFSPNCLYAKRTLFDLENVT